MNLIYIFICLFVWYEATAKEYRMICVQLCPTLASRDTFVPSKIVLKLSFLERDIEHDHLAEKSYWTKMGQKIHYARGRGI
jgi:hypothetical protein